MRLDKLLSDCGYGSRKEIKTIIDRGIVKVNGKLAKDGSYKVDEKSDIVEVGNRAIRYKKYNYYIMNKPAGYITATEDKREKTVMELLPQWVITKELAPVGRLDKDTEGLLLFTNNGQMAHELLSPKKHVSKVYYCLLEKEITKEAVIMLEEGVIIDNDYKTKEAKVNVVSPKEVELEIVEGKFHQVKKMMEAVNNKVLFLRRIRFGNLNLENLQIGEVKEIEEQEIIG